MRGAMTDRSTFFTLHFGQDGQPPTMQGGNPDRRATMQAVIDARHAVAMAHCRAKGWPEDPANLSFAQIFEIRALPEWVEAGGQ
jgi:hypothetical protein